MINGESPESIVFCKSYLHSHFREWSAQRIAYHPLSPRFRLVQNVADGKLVYYLAEPYHIIRKLIMHRRFSIDALKTIGDSLRYFFDYARYAVFSSLILTNNMII